MSDTALDVTTNTIEHLDFVQPCEHSGHETEHLDEPAKYLVYGTCGYCHDSAEYFLCQSGWKLLKPPNPLFCAECGNYGEDVFLTIIGTL